MKFSLIPAIALALALTACGGEHLDATYAGPVGATLEFKPNGKVIYCGMSEMDYEVDGKAIKLSVPGQATLVLKILDNGSIQYPLLGNFKKVSK